MSTPEPEHDKKKQQRLPLELGASPAAVRTVTAAAEERPATVPAPVLKAHPAETAEHAADAAPEEAPRAADEPADAGVLRHVPPAADQRPKVTTRPALPPFIPEREDGGDAAMAKPKALLLKKKNEAAAAEPPPAALPRPMATAELRAPEMPASAGGIGRTLREARERMGLSVAEVTERTRIHMDYVKAFEEDDYEKLPAAAIYVKSYLKSLCHLYRLPADEIRTAFEKARGGIGAESAVMDQVEVEPDPAADAAEDAAAVTVTARSPRALRWAIAALVALVGLIIVLAAGKSLLLNHRGGDVSAVTVADVEKLVPSEALPMAELDVPVASAP